MKKNISLVSESALCEDFFQEDHLKLCFLWYDEILLENCLNLYTSFIKKLDLNKKEMLYLTDVLLPLEKRVSDDLIKEYRKYTFLNMTYPRWQRNGKVYNTYRHPQNSKEYAHNAIIKKMRQYDKRHDNLMYDEDLMLAEMFIHIEDLLYNEELRYDEALRSNEGTARVAVNAIKLWEMVNCEITCTLQAGNYEKIAIEAALSFDKKSENKNEAIRLFELSVPSLTTVPWSKIIKLRKNNNILSLRNKLKSITESIPGDLKSAKEELNLLEKQAMNDIFEEYRPDVKKVAIETLIGNIPIAPINPASVFFGGKNIICEWNNKNKYDWFYLLRDIRNVANNSL